MQEFPEIDQSNLDAGNAAPRDYIPRTLKMAVRAVHSINSNQPQTKIIYHETSTIDLALPAPRWTDLSFDSFQGRETKIRFLIEISRENSDFFPQEFKEYLRFDLKVWGEILGGVGQQTLSSSSWIHPSSAYAGLKIILGPLADGPIHFVFSPVFQISPN